MMAITMRKLAIQEKLSLRPKYINQVTSRWRPLDTFVSFWCGCKVRRTEFEEKFFFFLSIGIFFFGPLEIFKKKKKKFFLEKKLLLKDLSKTSNIFENGPFSAEIQHF